ncbi:MAG: AbrB/MazE/SpoVT family DNA-binding domain-containing protein [Polaromonas sp.]
MPATAKVFSTGNSQAVRLPKAFRVDAAEMWITKNDVTGEITLKPKENEEQRRRKLEKLFQMIADDPLPDDFLSDATRRNEPARNPFAEWPGVAQPGGAKK